MPWYNQPNEPTEEEAKVLYRAPNKVSEEESELLSDSVVYLRLYLDVSLVTFGNVLWVLLFGGVLALSYLCGFAVLWVSVIGRPYATLCWNLARYYLWPFGKCVVVRRLPFFLASYASAVSQNLSLMHNSVASGTVNVRQSILARP